MAAAEAALARQKYVTPIEQAERVTQRKPAPPDGGQGPDQGCHRPDPHRLVATRLNPTMPLT